MASTQKIDFTRGNFVIDDKTDSHVTHFQIVIDLQINYKLRRRIIRRLLRTCIEDIKLRKIINESRVKRDSLLMKPII